MTGLVLLAFCLGFYFSTVLPVETKLAALQQDADTLQEKLRRSDGLSQGRVDSPDDQLLQFYRAFPDTKSTPDWLGVIHQAAQDQGLALNQGEYRHARDQGGRLTRYQITLPVEGPYLQIRKFVAAVLAQVPAASVDDIKFERQKIGDGTVEAKVRLTLYLANAR
jgi:Tfp pilus assembly protein PilO